MSVPIPSADLSQPDAGGALVGWEQREAVTTQIHTIHSSNPIPVEAAASEPTPRVVPLSDAELLAAFVQRRDADAFTEIVQRYRNLVYRVALRAVDDRHLADDVFQATFLVLAQSAGKIKRGEVLAAWLHGATRNIARRAVMNRHAEQKQLKDWAKQTLAQKGEEMATSTDVDPFEELARRNEQQLLDEELQQLPESSRAPLVLFYLEKKSQAEIAQIMGLSVEAVEGRLKRAKQELRTRLIRRGVLLSTVVAAATVLTPSITLAAPAASLVSATVTTALGTAALGSTALGATAVTGAATSSKLAAGSATASTLAAQEIAIMSVTSKATAMLITTAASTTLISGLVLGGMVGIFSMGAGGSAPTGSQSIDSQSDLQGIISESLDPGLISPAEDDQVQFALVEPEQQQEGAEQPAVKSEVTQEEVKPIVYPFADLSAEESAEIGEYAVSLAADISIHESTQSLVIRATHENHQKIAKRLEMLRGQRDSSLQHKFELVKARINLAGMLKKFDENHPDVKAQRNVIAVIEKAIAEGTRNPQVVEEQSELLGPDLLSPETTDLVETKKTEKQSPAQAEKVDENPNVEKPVTYQVGNLSADDLKDADDYARSIGLTVLLHRSTQSFVVRGSNENHRKLSNYLSGIRKKLEARAKLAKLLKEFDETHPEVKQTRNEIAAIEKSIADQSQGAMPSEKVKNDSDQSTARAETSDLSNRLVGSSFDVGDLSAEELLDVGEYAMSVANLSEVRASTQCIMVDGTLGEVHKISKYIEELRNKRPSQVKDKFKPLSERLKLAKQLKKFEENRPDLKRARDEIASMKKSIAEGVQGSNTAEVQSTFPERGEDPETIENITVTYSVADCASPKLILDLAKDVKKFAELVWYDPPTGSLVVKATRVNHRRIKGLILWSRESQSYAWDPQFELIWLKKRLSEKQREFGDDVAEVKSLRGEVESVEKKIAAKSPEEQVQHLVRLSDQIERQNVAIEQLRQQIDDLEGSGISPSKGIVTQVDQTTRTVWLNIGSRNNLQLQTTFSVADKKLMGVIRGAQDLKAKLEVVEVHYEGAVARIVEQDPKRPIQVGDSVFSPAWSDDEKTIIAFVGNSDLNGDGSKDDKDRRMFRSVVENARGEIALEINDEGVRVPADAKITAQTKWLVIGDLGDPLNGANGPAAQARLLAVQKQHDELVQIARENGVKIVSLKDFLTYMGWKPETRLIVKPNIKVLLITLQIGQERILTGASHKIGDLASVVSDQPDVVQVADRTMLRAVQEGTAFITLTDVDGKTATVMVEVSKVPLQYIRSVSLLRQLTPAEKRIYEVLRRQETLEFREQTLDQFAESMSARYQIPVKVDWQALDLAGVTKTATIRLSGLMRIEHALTAILSDVGGKRLEFYVDDGELHFTSQEAMKTITRARSYDLSPLTNEQWDRALECFNRLRISATVLGRQVAFDAPLAVHKEFEQFLAMETATGEVRNPNPEPVSADSGEAKEGPKQPAAEALVDQGSRELRLVVYPLEGVGADKLQDVVTFAESLSGTVSLDAATHSLVVNNTGEDQQKISDYLTKLRESQETEMKDKVEILAARKRLAAKVKELGKDHPEVRKAQAEVSKLVRAVYDRSEEAYTGERIAISTRIFEADDQALEQLADKDSEGRLILRKDAEKKLYSLSTKHKVVVMNDHRWLCRIGQPNTTLSGGEKPLLLVPEDWVYVGQELESVEFGTKVQLTVFDKKTNSGQRVMKYDVQLTHGYSDGNNPMLNGQELPIVTGRVFRGYVPLPEKESQGALIGPVGSVERTSEEGVTRKVSTYLWVRSEETRLVPWRGSK